MKASKGVPRSPWDDLSGAGPGRLSAVSADRSDEGERPHGIDAGDGAQAQGAGQDVGGGARLIADHGVAGEQSAGDGSGEDGGVDGSGDGGGVVQGQGAALPGVPGDGGGRGPRPGQGQAAAARDLEGAAEGAGRDAGNRGGGARAEQVVRGDGDVLGRGGQRGAERDGRAGGRQADQVTGLGVGRCGNGQSGADGGQGGQGGENGTDDGNLLGFRALWVRGSRRGNPPAVPWTAPRPWSPRPGRS